LKILLTGTAGFIGFHLCTKLLENNFEIYGIDNINDYYDPKLKLDRLEKLNQYDNFTFKKVDISNKNDVYDVFKFFKPKKVVNLAAQAGVRYSLKNPHAYVSSNLTGFVNIIESCVKNKVEGLIYASSSSIYGGNSSKPFKVSDKANKPLSLYGATKRANELIASSYSHVYNLNTTGLRYFTVYGPWYRPDMAINIFTKKILNGEPIDVFNNGSSKRDFTYINDIIDGTISAIDKNYHCEIFNLGNEKSEGLMSIINLIEKKVGIKAEINFKPIEPGDMLETFSDISYSKEKLNFLPKTSIETGIPIFIDWYRSYYNV
tara:strand:+ start:50 stop:1003 length:954 start_codon:yes stop_codon:yes gene_type:complete